MALQLQTAPTAEPISLAEAVAHLKPNEGAVESERISMLITAVRQLAEQELGRSLMPQTWRKTLDEFPEAIRLDMPPITAITSVKYYDEDETLITLASSDYQLDSESDPGWLVPAADLTWPATKQRANAVEVVYTAGYANAGAVPAAIKQWMLIHLRAFYDHPGGDVQRLEYVDGLLDRYRVMRA